MDNELSLKQAVIKGIATILWGDSWANHVEEAGCFNLSGCEITSIMPEIPKEVKVLAESLVDQVEQANLCTVTDLLAQAAAADQRRQDQLFPEIIALSYAKRFGNCLAWMTMGAGVSWWDDHEEFMLKVPYNDSIIYDLQVLAAENCEECEGKDECDECGCYEYEYEYEYECDCDEDEDDEDDEDDGNTE